VSNAIQSQWLWGRVASWIKPLALGMIVPEEAARTLAFPARPSEGLLTTLDKNSIRKETLPLMTMIDAANVAQRGLEKRLSHLKLSVAQQRILALVYFAHESLTPSMLAALLLQETHSISGLLNRLEDRDLITRTRDRQDRRVVWVGLTAAGRKVAEESINIAMSISNEFEPVLAGPNSNQMVDVVRQIRDLGFKIAGVREDIRREALKRVWGERNDN
jgi:DNA-binding MarR family transcriptional regulator